MRQVFDRSGYILDPHSAIGYLGLTREGGGQGQHRRAGVFLATAHPAKFPEIVEPVIGRSIEKPAALALALSKPSRILRLEATLAAVKDAVGA